MKLSHAIILAGASLLVFAACGGDGPGDPSPTATVPADPSETPVPATATPVPTPPALGELRPEWNILAEPASALYEPYDHYVEADFVGVIRVDEVSNNILVTFHSEMTGLDQSDGQAEIQATVLKPLKGRPNGSLTFVQRITFLPNLPEEEPVVGVTAFNPPLEESREYLVFVADGELLDGGVFAVHGGRVWNIGFWTDAESREYSDRLSGVEVTALSAEVVAAAHVGLPD